MVDETKARQSAQDMGETVREEARRAGETVREEAKAVADEAKTVGREHAEQRFEQGKTALDDQVDTIHSAVDGAARRLREENSPLASYADELSGQLSRLSDGIQNSSLDDLAVKTRQVARENPGLFVLGSIVAGIAAGRFFKASSERDHDDDDGYDHDGRESDDYRAGREAAMSGYRRDYRSPIAGGAPAPYRSATADDGNRASPAVSGGVAGSAGRVPMDSTLAGGAATASTTTTTTAAERSDGTSAGATSGTTTGAN